MIAIFTTLCVILYLFSFGVIELLHISNRKLLVLLSAAVAAGAALLFPNYAAKINFFEAFGIMTIAFTMLIPSLTLLIAIIRKKEGAQIE